MTATAASIPPPGFGHRSESPISEFYRDRSILVTGATGFMGKVLVEKLLRSCSDLIDIYVLLRPKRSHGVEDRCQQLLSEKIFDSMRTEQPHLLRKIVAVEGDVTKPGLGLSASDRETLTQRVSVVFNLAATVRFDEPFKVAVAVNIEGTVRLVELCRDMPHLVSFIHVSTAYSNCDRYDIKEKFYDPPYDPERFVDTINFLDETTVAAITPKLLGKRPNTYTVTKALAESLLLKIAKDLPMSIVRPSTVTAALREPLPSWLDNTNGPTGILAGGARGVFLTFLCYPDLVVDFIPVDLCMNLIVSVAWHTATATKPPLPKIYQIVSSAQNPLLYRELERRVNESYVKRPCRGVVWYPGLKFQKNRFVNNVCSILQHDIPSVLIDSHARLLGKKPFMTPILRRLYKATSCLEFFCTHDWNFTDTNVQKLSKELSPEDWQTFNFDVKAFTWARYIGVYMEGIRLYVFKDDPEIDEGSLNHMRRMHILKRTIEIMFMLLCFWLVAVQL